MIEVNGEQNSAIPPDGTTACGLCGERPAWSGTKRCDRCWELETRVENDPALARQLIAPVVLPNVLPALLAILREALREVDENPDRYEINAWCNECTMGCTPHRFDRGLCWVHKARKLIGENHD